MNNQNGINEQNEVVTPVEVIENNSSSLNTEVEAPHDLSKIQELVNQLESKIQKINNGDSENAQTNQKIDIEKVYQGSIQNSTMRQVVEGEMYVGKNPTLAKFVEEAKGTIVEALKNQMGIDKVPFSNSSENSPSLELITPTSFTENKEEIRPIGISSPPLRPANIFADEEILGEPMDQERSKVA